MTCANAKPAALKRALAWLTRLGVKHGSQAPVQFTSRRSSAAGCNGAPTTGDPSLRQNFGTRTTDILTRDRLKARALLQNNRDLQAVERYVKRHQTLIKGRCSDAN
jgi:hypothetical protein